MFQDIRLPKNSPEDKRKLVQYITRWVGTEFVAISNPCYYLKVHKKWLDIIYLMGLDNTFVESVRKQMPQEMLSRVILNDKITICILIAIISSVNDKDF